MKSKIKQHPADSGMAFVVIQRVRYKSPLDCVVFCSVYREFA